MNKKSGMDKQQQQQQKLYRECYRSLLTARGRYV